MPLDTANVAVTGSARAHTHTDTHAYIELSVRGRTYASLAWAANKASWQRRTLDIHNEYARHTRTYTHTRTHTRARTRGSLSRQSEQPGLIMQVANAAYTQSG